MVLGRQGVGHGGMDRARSLEPDCGPKPCPATDQLSKLREAVCLLRASVSSLSSEIVTDRVW